MTIKELKEKLNEYKDDDTVVVLIDEVNRYCLRPSIEKTTVFDTDTQKDYTYLTLVV